VETSLLANAHARPTAIRQASFAKRERSLVF
jgi:hypothetical protein